jgi:transaldolase
MKIFLDSSSLAEARKWRPVIDGATTNPTILKRDGGDIFEFCKELDPLPVSIEACGDFYTDARYYSSHISNAVIKVPLLNASGGNNLGVIKELSGEGIKVNCTALFSLAQVFLALRAGAHYVSLFIGRIEDEGGNWQRTLMECMGCVADHGYSLGEPELIVGSVRSVGHVMDCLRSRTPPDIITLPPAVLEKMTMHCFSLETVRQFERDHVDQKEKVLR